MIVYDLSCTHGHRFEGWFGSSDEFAQQQSKGLLCCPECGTSEVMKAPMAPAVGRKGNAVSASQAPSEPAASPRAEVTVPRGKGGRPVANAPMPPEVTEALKQLAEAQTKALKDSKWVGKKFAEESRAMHYGEQDQAAIHGEASIEEAQALADEGVPVAPLPFPVAPPEKLN